MSGIRRFANFACVFAAHFAVACVQAGGLPSQAAEYVVDVKHVTHLAGQYGTDDIGRFTFGNQTVTLAHVVPVTRFERCERSGRTYLCGHYGWQAWRTILDQQALVCSPAVHGRVECALPGRSIPDLGLWLIEGGWSRAEADAPSAYRDAEQRAHAAAIGIFSRP